MEIKVASGSGRPRRADMNLVSPPAAPSLAGSSFWDKGMLRLAIDGDFLQREAKVSASSRPARCQLWTGGIREEKAGVGETQ